MSEKVFLVHGWSVKETTTYQALHLKLQDAGYQLHEIFLGRYVSLDNEVEIKDIAKAMHNALVEQLGKPPWPGPFHLITHSTGALVVKHWTVHYYTGKAATGKPLKNIVFLAGPHFGSRLAHHGRTFLARIAFWGDTGKKVLTALELGSKFSWDNNEEWLDRTHWAAKGVRPFCLIGDRVRKDFFQSKIFPAGFEEGSDMVVRVAAGNLNFRRYELDGPTNKARLAGEITDVPFAALSRYVHSKESLGIMNSIKKAADPQQDKYLNLKLILLCLRVKTKADYAQARIDLAAVTKKTRKTRRPFAQLDFRFRDETGAPITDYRVTLGAMVRGKEKPSKTVVHTHKNKVDENHFTVYLDLKHLEPKYTYFVSVDSESNTELFSFLPDPLKRRYTQSSITQLIRPDETTQIDVVLERKPSRNLFVFHRGDDNLLHLSWDRQGEIKEDHLKVK